MGYRCASVDIVYVAWRGWRRRRKGARSGTARECSRCMHSAMYTGYTLPFQSRHYGLMPRENSANAKVGGGGKGRFRRAVVSAMVALKSSHVDPLEISGRFSKN